MKVLNKIVTAVLCAGSLVSCQKGLVYEDVPENVYENVNLAASLCNIESREWFRNKIHIENHADWGPEYPEYVENYIYTATIGNYQGENGQTYTNTTSSAVTIPGATIQPGETVTVKNSISTIDDATAPEGKVYVVNLFADAMATYQTRNKNHKFEAAKFSGDAVQPILIDPDANGRSEEIKLPVRPAEVIVAMLLDDTRACEVTPLNGAPTLGTPGDFSIPQRYMVTNTSRRPDGAPAKQRLYEIRITYLP